LCIICARIVALQELQATRQIIWHKEKTNYQYIKELANSPLVKDFRYLTILFESIWFGETEELFADDFQKIQPYFVNYLSRIKQLS